MERKNEWLTQKHDIYTSLLRSVCYRPVTRPRRSNERRSWLKQKNVCVFFFLSFSNNGIWGTLIIFLDWWPIWQGNNLSQIIQFSFSCSRSSEHGPIKTAFRTQDCYESPCRRLSGGVEAKKLPTKVRPSGSSQNSQGHQIIDFQVPTDTALGSTNVPIRERQMGHLPSSFPRHTPHVDWCLQGSRTWSALADMQTTQLWSAALLSPAALL